MISHPLAPYAIQLSKGRKYPEAEDPLRSPFQRDRDRIVHSKAFRRLSGKTQVFIPSYGDHYRSRLTHSLEVSMTSRDIARALALNEDLCECIALAHDLGHTPFGHAGEEAMNELMKKFHDHFEHNEQSLRVVEFLEKKSPDFPGLNLSFDVLEGLQKHEPGPHSLEAQAVDVADFITYLHHDIDDGLRSSLLSSEILTQASELWREVTEDLSFSALGKELFRRTAITRIIGILIHDLLMNFEKKSIALSEKIQKKADELYECLGEKLYMNEAVTEHALFGKKVVHFLFEWYSIHEEVLPGHVRKRFEQEKRHLVIKDYIAGMTDRFAIKRYNRFRK